MAWWIPLAMMAAGAAKGGLDQKAAAKKRKAEAEVARWSPWTGMSAQRVEDGPGVLGGAMQGGVSGLDMMQKMGGSTQSPKAPPGNVYDTTPGYTPSAPSAPSSTSGGEAMLSLAPQQSQQKYSVFGPGEAPPGYQWIGMGKRPPSLYGGQQPMMLAQN
jgi:hypothetical protein